MPGKRLGAFDEGGEVTSEPPCILLVRRMGRDIVFDELGEARIAEISVGLLVVLSHDLG
jgi:hypothetical protein